MSCQTLSCDLDESLVYMEYIKSGDVLFVLPLFFLYHRAMNSTQKMFIDLRLYS